MQVDNEWIARSWYIWTNPLQTLWACRINRTPWGWKSKARTHGPGGCYYRIGNIRASITECPKFTEGWPPLVWMMESNRHSNGAQKSCKVCPAKKNAGNHQLKAYTWVRGPTKRYISQTKWPREETSWLSPFVGDIIFIPFSGWRQTNRWCQTSDLYYDCTMVCHTADALGLCPSLRWCRNTAT